jgi:PAS domain S-box-containing protein
VLYGPADRLDADPLDDSPPLAVAALLVLCAGTLAIRADQGVPSMFSSPGPGGLVARRMAPLVAVPFAAVALALRYGGPTASTIAVLGTLLAPVLLLGVLAHTARRLDREHAELRREQAELRDERDFAGSLMQSMDEGVLVLDTDLRVIDANRAWCELSGLDRDDVIGEPPPYDRDPLSPNRPRPGNDWVARDQYIERSDGTMVPVMATRAAVVGEDGRTQAFIATYLNITSHKRADDRMAEQAGLLERANDELRETNHRLEQAAAFKGDLMSLVTHEMSQPLSSVSSLAELLTDTWGMLDEEVRQELTAKIYKNAQRLVGLVRDMLLLYHLDTGTVTARRSPVLVDEAMDGVIAGFAGLPEIVRDIEPAACALVDGSHLSQVLTNLLRNAVSYGQPPITVSARQCGDHLVLTIEDRGTGIPDEVRSRMFDRAVRPSTASGTGLAKGRGLGLLIARHLVTANGGTIGYQPVEPTGARLVVTLEAAVPPEAGGVPLPVPGIAVRQ